jgi:hypothetical protein
MRKSVDGVVGVLSGRCVTVMQLVHTSDLKIQGEEG